MANRRGAVNQRFDPLARTAIATHGRTGASVAPDDHARRLVATGNAACAGQRGVVVHPDTPALSRVRSHECVHGWRLGVLGGERFFDTHQAAIAALADATDRTASRE
jgi:hypothetical protein